MANSDGDTERRTGWAGLRLRRGTASTVRVVSRRQSPARRGPSWPWWRSGLEGSGLVPLLLLLCAVACRGPRRNAEQLVFAVRALRDAPNAAKANYLEALQTQSCDTQELCDFKARCVQAYEPHVDALRQIERVDSAQLPPFASAEPQAERAARQQRSLAALKSASELLETAHQLARDCLRHETTVSEAFRL